MESEQLFLEMLSLQVKLLLKGDHDFLVEDRINYHRRHIRIHLARAHSHSHRNSKEHWGLSRSMNSSRRNGRF